MPNKCISDKKTDVQKTDAQKNAGSKLPSTSIVKAMIVSDIPKGIEPYFFWHCTIL